jgi:RimJ/RimL family protein N-acetyltransferase
VLEDPVPLSTGFARPVELRRMGSADARAFADHVAGDVERLGEHLPWPALTATAGGAEPWLERYEHGEDGRVVVGGAWAGDELLGGALLFHHDPVHANVELGCWVVAAGEGHGVAAAACRALLARARSELLVERVEWRAATGNARSRRLAERLGFSHEGTLRSSYELRGSRYDTDLFSLVGDEIDRAVAGG